MEKKYNLIDLYNQKKYSEIIYIIEFELPENKKNSSIINLLGVCRLSLVNRNRDDVILAIKDFKQVYTKEKNTKVASSAFGNFVNAAADLYDSERSESNTKEVLEYFNEALSFFNHNEKYLLDNELVVLAIVRIHKRLVDIKNVIFLLGQLIKKKHLRSTTICSYIYNNCYFGDWSQEKFLEYSRMLNDSLICYNQEKLLPLLKPKNDKITVGFFSADLHHNHSVSYFLRSIIKNYDKNKFAINLYFNHKKSQKDELTEFFIENVNKSSDIRHLRDEEAINTIRKDNVDIFIDLMGISSVSRLSLIKNRVAPNQVSWCGYNNTTGVKEMDYILSDPNLIFESEKNMYEEKIIYLPKIWNCHVGFNLKRKFISPPLIKNNYITFGSFNNFSKINDNVINVWSKILSSVRNSKLILKTSNVRASNLLISKFKNENVLDSVEFLSFEKDFKSHMNSYQKIDIALDTFPYTGVTTSFEAIWMGVPVLTMKGFNFQSRCGESINKNLDLNWLCAENAEDYIFKAKELSQKKDFIFELRKKLFDTALVSPLFDTSLFAKDFFKTLELINKQ